MTKALFINGGPRKNKNTMQVMEKAMEGARDAGAEVEIVHLYDLNFKGCKSCFACKLKNAKTDGVCAIKDDLRPVLEKAHEADVIVLGSPVYYSYPTGEIRSFMERLMFPVDTYVLDENGVRQRYWQKTIPTAMILTMNVPEQALEQWNYPTLLGINSQLLGELFGYSETLMVCNTYQFNDYSKYAINLFREEDKARQRKEHFPIDLQNAYELGKRLVEKTKIDDTPVEQR